MNKMSLFYAANIGKIIASANFFAIIMKKMSMIDAKNAMNGKICTENVDGC